MRKHFYIRWRIGRSKAEELRLPPRSEEFESTAEERSVIIERTAGVADSTGRRSDPRRETSRSALRTPSTGVEATPKKGERILLESK